MWHADASLTLLINGLAGRWGILDGLMIAVSAWGIPIMVLAVALQWWAGTERAALRHTLVSAGFAFFLGLGINQIILLFVTRTRPYLVDLTNLIIAPSADPSFPSDHATAGFAIAVIFLLARMRYRAIWFGAAAILIAFSRVFIGIHYFGDVLGGAVTGALAAVIVRIAYRRDTRLDRMLTNIL